jgi:N-acylneuraminate cytidylyltransferase
MIEWPVKAALESGIFKRVIVSTDDEEIADISRACGAEVPLLRRKELADDNTPVGNVLKEGLTCFNVQDPVVCLIYATAAGLSPEHIRRGFKDYKPQEHDFLMGVVEFPHPVQRAIRLRAGRVEMVSPENATTRTQDLEPLYHDAGQLVFGRREVWAAGHSVWTAPTAALILPPHLAVDIDTEEDWITAERLLQTHLSKCD